MNKLFFLSLLELSAAHAKKSREIFTTLGVSDAQPKILYILLAEDGWLAKRSGRVLQNFTCFYDYSIKQYGEKRGAANPSCRTMLNLSNT